nr:hypothetical protein [Anaerolineae bacterium]
MKPEDQLLLRQLLNEERILSLAVAINGEPYLGLLPFVTRPDYKAILIHASDLAKHSEGLQTGASFSVLIHAADRVEADPLQIPRIALQGRVQKLQKGSEQYAAAREAYLSRFPTSAPTFLLGDFNLYALHINTGRMVVGFARTIFLTSAHLAEIADQ